MIATDERVENAAANLQRMMDERDLSYRKLGELSGVSYRTIHCFASRRNDPSLSIVLKLVDALEVTLEEFLSPPKKGG